MSTLHFVDADGNYIGGFGDGAVPPDGAIEVKAAPSHGLNKFDHKSNKWDNVGEEAMKRREKKRKDSFKKIKDPDMRAILSEIIPDFEED